MHTHTHTHTHTSRRQLKITFLDVFDYYEYSDTNISKFFFHDNIVSSVRKQKLKNVLKKPSGPSGKNSKKLKNGLKKHCNRIGTYNRVDRG